MQEYKLYIDGQFCDAAEREDARVDQPRHRGAVGAHRARRPRPTRSAPSRPRARPSTRGRGRA